MSPTPPNAPQIEVQRIDLPSRYHFVRTLTRRICEPLQVEDFVVQSMPDTSPTRWHLAHTTWFFETFVLEPHSTYRSRRAEFKFLFNSYYNSIGKQFPQSQRGLLSRPTVSEIWDYRDEVDAAMLELLANSDGELATIVELGIQHEQQHQELILTDIKHVLSCNPMYPAYRESDLNRYRFTKTMYRDVQWVVFESTIHEIGYSGKGFCFDNELPRHRVILEAYELQDRLVSNGEYLQFIQDGGYQRPELWLSMGWAHVQSQNASNPLYWLLIEDEWFEFTLWGLLPLDENSPVCHVSYYEADAYARWSKARLPTEHEWERAVAGIRTVGNLAQSENFHPVGSEDATGGLRQCFGDVWEWTSSPYMAYPGYVPAHGAVGEYNGKFMCNQFVLRGGSCVTPHDHIRPSYRNFFPPHARWQFSGIRLAH